MELQRYLLLGVALFLLVGRREGQLVENFYGSACPNVESIVRQVVSTKISQTFVTIPATLRLFFHDCFVEGCDGSILIASPNGDAEKDASDNQSLAGDGFDTVIKAKQALEAVCPGVVSCADILAIAARDVVTLSRGPQFNVELGRRDGRISRASRVTGNLPEPTMRLDELNAIFAKNNLTQTDMIALSGAHSVGFSHCSKFAARLYSSSGIDPTLNPTYANQLMQSCPANVDPTIAVNMDPNTPQVMDNVYYQNLLNGMGMFTSDQVLFTDTRSRSTVNDFANSVADFSAAFATAMVKLGRTKVKTGFQGEIRRDCSAFN